MSFGLVNVPVRLYSATENHDLNLHQVRASDGSRIRYKRVAQTDGEEVAYRDIAKAYETPDGRTVVLTEEDLASLPSRSSKEITVEKFVPAEQIDPLLFDRAYYIEPDAMGAKAYGLLREALRETERVALVTVAVRTRMTMGVLRVVDDVIVLQTLLWPDEVRDSGALDHLDEVTEPKESEIGMARMLVDSMTGEFTAEEYEDDYQVAIEALVQAKIEGGDVAEAPEAEEEDTGEVVDLLAALQRSVERAKAGRSGQVTESAADPGDEGEEEPQEDSTADDAEDAAAAKTSASGTTAPRKSASGKPAAKKSAPKKTAAKKTAATKSTAKKTTGKRSGSEGGSSGRRAG